MSAGDLGRAIYERQQALNKCEALAARWEFQAEQFRERPPGPLRDRAALLDACAAELREALT